MSKSTRILVVDSDLHTISIIYLSLNHKNYKVEASDNALEIMTRAERFKPRLIILNTATKNLTLQVYQDLSHKRIPVLLINDGLADIPVESKRWEVVTMPSDMGFFDRKIREVMQLID